MSNQKFTVLLVEDNPGDARLIQELLGITRGDYFVVETVDKLSAAMERLEGAKVDAVLLDLALPDSHGKGTFAQVKAHAPDVPIIVLTGLGDEALALEMVQQRAQDYLVKADLNANILSRSIRYAIERASMDRQIRKLNAELEEKVQERTRELEAANKELEAFSYSVSHDLRAPIRHITGFSEILASDHASRLDPDGEECVRHILEAANHMSVMTDGLLKLAQVSRQPLIMENTSLNLLVELAVRELSAETEGRRIEWKVGVLPSVACDPGLMEQVFANLIGNAVKYTRHREVATIEIGQILVHGEPVIFVADNGAGFDMRYADKLFGAFQRLHDRKEFEGTGVGLSTVQRIIQKQGGRIWAESAPDHGARFSFTLSTSVAQRAG